MDENVFLLVLKSALAVINRRYPIAALALVLGLLILSFTIFALSTWLLRTNSMCISPFGSDAIRKSQLSLVTLGSVTKFSLPLPKRYPNGIIVSEDGSVWFGEEGVPATAHLYQNGTLIEYRWPGSYPLQSDSVHNCYFRTEIWSLAIWNGLVWATDEAGSQLIGLNPITGKFAKIPLEPNSFPFFLSVAPNGSLWLTELYTSKIVRINQNYRVEEYSLPTSFRGTPTSITFVNDTLAYYSDAGEAGLANGGIFSFNPSSPSGFTLIGSTNLSGVTSVVYADGSIWVSEHGPSNVMSYNAKRGWEIYPTSAVHYSQTTLPYFLASDGRSIWFNEHYANRIAHLDPVNMTLFEYSLSNNLFSNLSGIDNALTIAIGLGKIWFTALTSNYVGYVDGSKVPGFSIDTDVRGTLISKPGDSIKLTFNIRNECACTLNFSFFDSETPTSRPQNISARMPSIINSGYMQTVDIELLINDKIKPGNYMLLFTLSDGLTYISRYVELEIQQTEP